MPINSKNATPQKNSSEKKISKPKAKSPSKSKVNSTDTNDYFEAIFKNSEFGIVIFDLNGKIINVNKAIVDVLGYSKKELNELTVANISHPQDNDLTQKLIADLFNGKLTRAQTEKRYISKNGKVVPTRVTIFVAKKVNSKVVELIAFIEDLTDQKEIIKRLENEQTLLDTLLENIPDSIYFKDRKSRFVRINNALARKHGLNSPEESYGRTDFDIFGIEHSTQAFNDEQEIIRTGIPLIGKEEKEDWLDGRTTWGSTTKMPWYDKYGNIIGTFGITRDITEKVLNQEQIKLKELLYRSLFTNSVDGIFLIDESIIDCNQAILDLLQYEREEFIGLLPSQFSPEFQPNGKNSHDYANEKIALAFNGTPQRFYWMPKRKDGKLIDTEISLNKVMINGRKLVQAVMRDITERLQNEKLREAVFAISETAYTISNMYNLYEKVHQEVSNLMPAKNFYIALLDEKQNVISFPYFVDEFDPPQEPKKPGRGLTEYVMRLGTPALIDAKKDLELREQGEVDLIGAPQAIWLGVPLKIEGKTLGVIVVQDYENEKAFSDYEVQILSFVAAQVAQVIERKRNADEMKKITLEIQQLNATKDKFFSIIAHDLRNPFITILGFSDLLISDYSELTDDERKFYLEEMKKSAELSHNLLQNLLQWSRSQTGRIEFNQSAIFLHHVINSNFDLLESSAEKKDIKMISEISDNIKLFADEDMLNTILRNLLTNSIKFTPRNGIITVSATLNKSFANISVSDTGVGMDEIALNNLFRIDISHSSHGTDHEAGTGLGLILCKEFVEKHGGTISVSSKPGKGTTFTFTIPLDSAQTTG